MLLTFLDSTGSTGGSLILLQSVVNIPTSCYRASEISYMTIPQRSDMLLKAYLMIAKILPYIILVSSIQIIIFALWSLHQSSYQPIQYLHDSTAPRPGYPASLPPSFSSQRLHVLSKWSSHMCCAFDIYSLVVNFLTNLSWVGSEGHVAEATNPPRLRH